MSVASFLRNAIALRKPHRLLVSAVAAISIAAPFAGPALASAMSGVTIYRDKWGVPYIYAAREEDGYLGLGYSLAEDRPTRFFELVLWGTGQWAALRGNEVTPVGIPASMLDDWAHQWRHVEEAKAAYQRLDPQMRRNFESFAQGFERFFSEHPERRPAWAPKLEPWHPIAVMRGVFWPFSMINDGMADCARGGVQVGSLRETSDSALSTLASNEWVAMPAKTANGKTILLSDPHGPIDGGLIFNEFNLRAGRLHVSAYGIGPIPVLGHTKSIAWAATTGAPDLSDCVAIDVDPANPRRYRFDGKWRTMEVVKVDLAVKGSSSTRKEYEYTRHNGVLSPVVARQGNKAFVISSPYMHEGASGAEEFQRFVSANSVDDVFRILHDPKVFGQNFMFADRAGNALYVRLGRTPKRPDGYDWRRPVPGNTSASAWTGIHPVEDLVWVKNPKQGYMKNTNEAPNQIVRDASPVRAADFKPYIYNDPGFSTSRALRLGNLLANARAVTTKDAFAIALDEQLPFTPRWQAALRSAVKVSPKAAVGLSKTEHGFAESILAFDGVMTQSSILAARYLMWREAIKTTLSADQSAKIMNASIANVGGAIDESVAAGLLTGVRSAAARMQTYPKGLNTPYGSLFRIGRGKGDWPLGGGTICLNAEGRGCEETLRAFAMGGPDEAGRWRPGYGSRMLRLVFFGREVEAYAAFNFGQSDDSSSPHYDDQARELLSRRTLRRVYETEDALIAAGATKQVLAIAGGSQR